MGELKAVEKDMAAFRNALKYFGLTKEYMSPENIVELKDITSKMDCFKAIVGVKKRIKLTPEKNFLILWCLAGHGMNWSGY